MTRRAHLPAGGAPPGGRGGRAGGAKSAAVSSRKGVLAVVLTAAFFLVIGMGVTEAYLMGPCGQSPVFGAAGGHGDGFCRMLKASGMAPALAGEIVLLVVLLSMLAAARLAGPGFLQSDRTIRTAGAVGVFALFAVNTTAMTSLLLISGCTTFPPLPDARGGVQGEGAGERGWCQIAASAHPVVFDRHAKLVPLYNFRMRDASTVEEILFS